MQMFCAQTHLFLGLLRPGGKNLAAELLVVVVVPRWPGPKRRVAVDLEEEGGGFCVGAALVPQFRAVGEEYRQEERERDKADGLFSCAGCGWTFNPRSCF